MMMIKIETLPVLFSPSSFTVEMEWTYGR